MASVIRPTTPVSTVMPEATPSKKVNLNTRPGKYGDLILPQAAAALQAISLESPVKHKVAPVIDDARRSASPDSETDKVDCKEVNDGKRFVGELDLPESTFSV